ncbi:MAG: energy-coupling factor ABC transporter permease [Betaproteobacteria bacterium]|nr:energy-coupling factor ABC transporter permease [Betaproteobacteria bacterium]
MEFTLQSLPEGTALLCMALIVWALWSDWRRVAWKSLILGPVPNRLIGTTMVLTLLWSMGPHLSSGLAFHFLGVTACVLIFGRGVALAALVVASLAACWLHGGDVWAWPFNFVLLGLFPAWLTSGADRWLQRHLPNHIFVFIFLNTFLVAGLVMLAIGCVATAVLAFQGETLTYLLQNYFPYFLMLGFGEAWLSGLTITLLIVYWPGWVASFDDRRFLMNK